MPQCFAWLLLLATGSNQPVAGQSLVYLGCEPAEISPWAAAPAEAQVRGFQSGQLLEQPALNNRGCWHFDGRRTLVHCRLPVSAWTGAFTWEGFFLSPRDNRVTFDQAISDRFLTQFADADSQRTRLAVGLTVPRDGQLPRLCVALTGYSLRLGSLEVRPDVWHHFAVTYEPFGRTIGYGRLTWYLDYRPCGYFTVDGLAPESTLLPPGPALLAIGGRNAAGGKVDRGFEGFLDELRITARALAPAEFLHVRRRTVSRPVKAEFFGPLKPDFSWTDLPAPVETQTQEALPLAGFPPAYSFSGVPTTRRGWHAARTSRRMTLPEGNYTIRLQTRAAAVLAIDGKALVDCQSSASGSSDSKPAGAKAADTDPPMSVEFHADGRAHDFVLTVAVDFGSGKAEAAAAADNQPDQTPRAESGLGADEVIVTYSKLDSKGKPVEWQLLGSAQPLMTAPYWWLAYRGRMLEAWQQQEPERRSKAARRRDEFWAQRHAWAVSVAEGLAVVEPPPGEHPIDFFLDHKLRQLGVSAAPLVDDATFARRVTLDLAGRVPAYAEAQAFLSDTRRDKRERLIDRLLASSEWGDAWVGYWQDLLAENPSILKPTLNNSGPFRFWIHRSLADNKPLDQFAAELLLMDGIDELGGTAGFGQASGNDLPMAMKAHVIGKAFLGIDMKCARCHDAPNAAVGQADLFSLAAMLEERPIVVPAQSVVLAAVGAPKPAVSSSLAAGDRVLPAWPLEKLLPAASDRNGYRLTDWIDQPRAELASIILSPHQTRFADVMVNRLWQRFMGAGLVEPLDQWFDRTAASHPDLLAWLSRELVKSGYDAKHLSQLIVTSQAYQRQVQTDAEREATGHTLAGPTRRRLSAEQLVDSIYLIAGKAFEAEELNFDPHGSQGFLKLPAPKRAWQCASLANERDRPALALPVNQQIVDVLSAFGWRETRPDPLTRGVIEAGPSQPLLLANSLMVNHALRLTEDSGLLPHCLQATSPADLAERLFVCVLARRPDTHERAAIAAVLTPGFDRRLTGKPAARQAARPAAHVDWDRHLQGATTTELLQAARSIRQGPAPTVRLSADFRERAEDVVWALVNCPEFVLVP
ncbi:MAG TPA: DUF1553 domain-containing protein [Pirellulales bacterium]|jgi:hypothetical protein|nr:DUF1553 domain-containing protein [Pirellulales bacterium]